MAIGLRTRHDFGPNRAACAGSIIDDERGTKARPESLHHLTRDDVSRASRGERNNHAYGLFGIGLSRRSPGCDGRHDGRSAILNDLTMV